jgi:hypothetical protein
MHHAAGLVRAAWPPPIAQLASPSGNAWDAAAWTGLQRSSSDPSAWVDGEGAAASGARWCPGEPNNLGGGGGGGGGEGCAALLTVCSSSGAALANDLPCSRALRVLCAFEAPAECVESWVLYPSQGSPSSCTQQAGGAGCPELMACSLRWLPLQRLGCSWPPWPPGPRAPCAPEDHACQLLSLDDELHRR